MKPSHVKKRMLGIAAALVIAVSAMAATAGTKATHTQHLN